MLGDFNARIGKTDKNSNMWREVRGRHRMGICKEAGVKMLKFCVLHGLSAMNVWKEAAAYGHLETPCYQIGPHDRFHSDEERTEKALL